MTFIDKLLGRPLSLKARKKQELTVITGIPALGLDSLASIAYGPEAALMILLPLGVMGLHHFLIITLIIVFVLISLYFSYRQTAYAYPNGGGAYIVASDNLGKTVGLWAAIALLLDYLLNVAVGISAGVGAIVSAFPFLHNYMLTLCLLVLLMLTILNLRGIRESGLFFIIPTLCFVGCLLIVVAIGLIQTWQSGGHPHAVIAPPTAPPATETLSIWLLLAALANGLTAMTGVEAVSNAIPLFRKPKVKNAQWTLTAIVGILAMFLLSIAVLSPAYHIVAMQENHPGYQTILSQLTAAVTGKGIFYYISIISIFIVLTYSAQTSFADFPRVCRLLAEDDYLPSFFAERGRRLVFSHGIVILALVAAVLLIVFKGVTSNLIPLFAVGAFSAFLFSQTGMILHWLRHDGHQAYFKLTFNAIGALVTAIALCIIIITKFMEGAWIIVLIAPLLAFLMIGVRHHYAKIRHAIQTPIELNASELKPPVVIIPIQGLDRVAEKAIQFGMLLSDEITAVLIDNGTNDIDRIKNLWSTKIDKPAKRAHATIPHLKIIKSPYRQIYKPLLRYVEKVKKQKHNRLIAVVIPELVEPYWYEYLLHNIHAAGLRTLLFLERDQRTIVITIPWYLHD